MSQNGYKYVWYNIRKSIEVCDEVKKNYNGVVSVQDLIHLADEGLEGYRKACTYFYERHYLYNYGNYPLIGDTSGLLEFLVERFVQILGKDNYELYTLIRKNYGKSGEEFWGGNECYRLFSYGQAPRAERCIIKSLVTLKTLYMDGNTFKIQAIDNNMSTVLKKVDDFRRLCNGGISGSLYDERSVVNGQYLFDLQDKGDREGFMSCAKEIDKDGEIHMNLWYKFMSLVAEGNYEEAYNITTTHGAEGFDYFK